MAKNESILSIKMQAYLHIGLVRCTHYKTCGNKIIMKTVKLGVLLVLLSSCATQKMWVATGGSRADGVVSVSYDYGAFEVPEVSEAQGQAEAAGRCAVWGYGGAEAFGGSIATCVLTDGFGGCNRWRVTKDYQCTSVTN